MCDETNAAGRKVNLNDLVSPTYSATGANKAGINRGGVGLAET